jgi:SAM-dependent methyltransferase
MKEHFMSNQRFDQLYRETLYIELKNHLYNYLLRRRAVRKTIKRDIKGRILEVGSGISPLVNGATQETIYTDISFNAMLINRRRFGDGFYVVADAVNLPFKSGSFSFVVCSEVLEHLREDQKALAETARILNSGGRLVITFPHRRCYFSRDDRYVNHFRRYEIDDIKSKIRRCGFSPVRVGKVLGPLEKVTMWSAVFFFQRWQNRKMRKSDRKFTVPFHRFMVILFIWMNRIYAGLAWMDARITPRALAAVMLMVCRLNRSGDTP